MRIKTSFWSALIVIALVLPISGATDDSLSTTAVVSDGPHVLWQNEHLATVFYWCDSSVIRENYTVDDTLRFHGLCADSTIEYVIPSAPPAPASYSITTTGNLFVCSDIHGEYEAFVDLLRVAGVIDTSLQWTFGDGHLVIDGDVFDRGDMVLECLWLIYRLEQEAAAAGGGVLLLLGNHELMVLRGDNRYIHESYLQGLARKARIRHEDLYGPDMELGRWLRSKPVIARINDLLFVHGGISAELTRQRFNLESINQLSLQHLDERTYWVAVSDTGKFLFGSRGPFWYRGLVKDAWYPKSTMAQVDSILAAFDVSTIVVGHSEVDSLTSFYDGKVYAIDVPLDELGALEGLIIENKVFYRLRFDGTRVRLSPEHRID